jgi:hypothetical protein
MNMHYLCQHLVPTKLTPERTETGMTLAGDLITKVDVSFLNNIVTGDETWCFCTTHIQF